ncbi:hypothetical protein JTB14_021100 [Gonioctena quinquepunctata]|nr:hypothetical protein JTB14_021100 [Gonioctena quinquepunctata]
MSSILKDIVWQFNLILLLKVGVSNYSGILSYIVSILLVHHACANSIKAYVAYKDSLSEDVLINTLPSLGLEKFGGRLYYFETIFKGNYYKATQFCNFHDMELVSIESKSENNFLRKHIQAFLGSGEYHFWTSGTTMPDDHWVWLSTGRPILFTNWAPNEPDNAGGNEKCLEVYTTIEALLWNDHGCTEEKYVICETSVPKSISNMLSSTSYCNLTIFSLPEE